MGLNPSQVLAAMNARSLSAKLIGLGGMMTFMLLLYTYSSPSFRFNIRLPEVQVPFFNHPSPSRVRATCPPDLYNAGQWTYAPSPVFSGESGLNAKSDALKYAGLEGCAADREYDWHLGTDKEEMWDRWPNVTSWKWEPAEGCDLRPMQSEAFVKDLVEQGGWLLLGDSITEQHFFSLSCLLYPHVRATPNYTENPYFDRSWPQNLYLSPDSPLVHQLQLPPDFSITDTPLVTFRRIDLLMTKEELIDIHASLHPDLPDGFELFSDEQAWNLSPDEYMPLFTDPKNRYGTLVASTGGHWTTTLFHGLRDESKADDGYGIDGVLSFFSQAMRKWAERVQKALDEDQKLKGLKRQVVVRAYLPGHEDCHDHRAPWKEVQPMKWNWYNWAWIKDFNRIFQDLLSLPFFPDVHFLPIDRPARLRPDAHATGDCLHIMTGVGVLEGWSHYIWHFVTRELPGRIR